MCYGSGCEYEKWDGGGGHPIINPHQAILGYSFYLKYLCDQ